MSDNHWTVLITKEGAICPFIYDPAYKAIALPVFMNINRLPMVPEPDDKEPIYNDFSERKFIKHRFRIGEKALNIFIEEGMTLEQAVSHLRVKNISVEDKE